MMMIIMITVMITRKMKTMNMVQNSHMPVGQNILFLVSKIKGYKSDDAIVCDTILNHAVLMFQW